MRYTEDKFTEEEIEAIESLAKVVCFVCGLLDEELRGKSRVRPAPDARKMVCKYVYDNINIGTTDGGSNYALSAWFFNQDHSTINHSVNEFNKLYITNEEFKIVYDKLIESINNPEVMNQFDPQRMYLVEKTWELVRYNANERLSVKYNLMPEDIKSKSIDLYHKGYGYQSIACEVGTDAPLIIYLVKRMNIKRDKVEKIKSIRSASAFIPTLRVKNEFHGFF